MSDHDTADRALVEQLKDQCIVNGEHGDHAGCCFYHQAAHALARRIAEGERLRKVVKALADRACDCAPFGRHECLVCQARTALVAEEPPR